VLDSLADEAMTTGDENDVRHAVRVWTEGRGGRGKVERRREIGEGEGSGFMGGSHAPPVHLAHYMKPAQNGQTLRERQ
jgi:hypothetical protein